MGLTNRTPFGNVHTEECANIDCPCYQEGSEVRAWNHWSMVMWLAEKDPDLLREALAEVGATADPPVVDGDPNSLTARIERALLARHPVTLRPDRARNYAELAAYVAQGGS